MPATPVLTQPANGSRDVARRPRIEGTAEPGVTVRLYLEGAEYAKVVADSAGAFSYEVPEELAEGAHQLQASAEELGSYSPQSSPTRFHVTALGAVSSPIALQVGCGCGASPGAGLGAVALVLALGAARRRRRG